MKIAVIGDPHIGCTKYTDKRISDFSKQFVYAMEKALDRDVKAIFILGDIFDSSAYRRSVDSFANHLSEIAPVLVKARKEGIPIFTIAGNHEYGRGREAGELRILNDLGFIHLLRDENIEFKNWSIAGISWKSDIESFRSILKSLGKPKNDSILLIHQFCFGSKFIPYFISEVNEEYLKDWNVVFTGHHHVYEDLGYVIAPGSLEVHSANEISEKGFIIFDTESSHHEFVKLPRSRPVYYVKISADKKDPQTLEKEIESWISAHASTGALLIINLSGSLSPGRSIDINWTRLQSIGIQKGCLAVSFEGGIEDKVRSAPEIRSTVNFEDFLKKRFKGKGKLAVEYVEKLKEVGDDFGTLLLDKIIEEVGKKKGRK